jgi:hypothetical protein
MKHGITLEELSKTFPDAVNCAQQFGLHHIWIYSLCIIQDSVEDWQKESARMGQVYANGYFNISAIDAVDSSHGIYYKRNAAAIQPIRIRMRIEPDLEPETHQPYHPSL